MLLPEVLADGGFHQKTYGRIAIACELQKEREGVAQIGVANPSPCHERFTLYQRNFVSSKGLFHEVLHDDVRPVQLGVGL